MANESGLDSQLGFAAEGTVGTYQTPTRFVEFVDENLKRTINRVESRGLRAGRRTRHRWAPTTSSAAGDVNIEFAPENTGLLLEHMLGDVSTAGASDPWTHTFTPGSLTGKALTLQVNRPDINGTDRVFSYLGSKVVDWTFSASVGEYLMLRLGIYAQHEDTAQTLATASYDANWEPFVYTHGALTLGGTEVPVKSATLDGNNGLRIDRHFIQGTNPERPLESLEANFRAYSGSLVADWNSLTDYNRFVNGTEAALVLTFDRTADNRSLVITQNVRVDGDTPSVSGDDILEQTIPYVAISNTNDAGTITIDLENGDSAP